MMTSLNGIITYLPFMRGIHRSPVDFPHKGQWRGAWGFLDLRLNIRLSKRSRRRWFETPLRSLWRHCNVHPLKLDHELVITSHCFIWMWLLIHDWQWMSSHCVIPVSEDFCSTCPKTLARWGFNFNPSMDKQSLTLYSVGWNYLSIPKLQRLQPLKFRNGKVISSHTL